MGYSRVTPEFFELYRMKLESGRALDDNDVVMGKSLVITPDRNGNAGMLGSNGHYFRNFSGVMTDFEQKRKGCKSQTMNIVNKKITVLSDNAALLTASGSYSLALDDGRILTGKFAWTLVYSKMNEGWRIIHSHM